MIVTMKKLKDPCFPSDGARIILVTPNGTTYSGVVSFSYGKCSLFCDWPDSVDGVELGRLCGGFAVHPAFVGSMWGNLDDVIAEVADNE